jgi:hypothetical protein
MTVPDEALADRGDVADDRPPRIITVVDTEEEFDWTQPFDRAATGISHLERIGELQAVFDAQGVCPVYTVDYAVASQASAVDALAPIAQEGRALIGAHLHPWVTPPFVEDVTPRNSYPGNLPAAVEYDKLAILTERITAAFGERPTIYTAGRYGIGPNTFDTLEELGFTVDLSLMPSFDYSEDGGPDFSRQSLEPSWVGRAKRVLSIPNTSGLVGYLPQHNYRMLSTVAMDRRMRALRLPAVLSRLGLVERIALSPEGYSLADMRRLTRALYRAGHRLFVLRLHSPSVAPGHTPYVRDETDRRTLLSTIGRYLDFFRREFRGETTDPLAVRRELAGEATRLVPGAAVPGKTTGRLPRRATVSVDPIDDADLPEIAAFWNRNLNPGIPCDVWVKAFRQPWMPEKPNNGFQLRAAGRLVGTLGAIYSRQRIAGEVRDFCNLTSLVVNPEHRARSMDLLSACLAQKNLCFTNFTPTPAVAKMLRLLRFTELPSGEYLVPHLPIPAAPAGFIAIEADNDLDRILTGEAAQLWRDHRGFPWLNRFAIGHEDRWCLLFWKKAMVKGMPAASVLGVSDTALLHDWHAVIGGHLLLHHGMLASRIDAHLLPRASWIAVNRPVVMPHLVRASPPLPAELVTFLYSEMAALPL